MNPLIVGLFSGLIALAQVQSAEPLTVEQVRDVFEHGGCDTETPIYWESSQLTTFFARDSFDDRVLLVFVYPDVATAEQEHRATHAEEEAERGTALVFDDDHGPRLMPGYGRSAWWQNVAIMQALQPPLTLNNDGEPMAIISTNASRRSELAALPTVDRDFVLLLRSVAASAVSY